MDEWSHLNIIDQTSINKKGEKAEKKRLTHDQYFPGVTSQQILNSQVIVKEFEPMIYVFMFL